MAPERIAAPRPQHGAGLRGQRRLPHVPRFENDKAVAAAPADWLPWNYAGALARLESRHVAAA